MEGIDGWWDSLVRDRARDILELVLNEIADDYENLDTIMEYINRRDPSLDPANWEALRAIPVSRPEVISALTELVREGFAQAYILQSHEPYSRPVKLSQGDIGSLWFLVTAKGAAAVKRLSREHLD